MIKIINDKKLLNEENFKEMYNILIENLFITYPKFLLDRDKYDNMNAYNKWINMIKNTNDYNVIAYIENNIVIGFLNYSVINDDMWISEVQIKNEYKNKGILKKLLKEFVSLEDVKKYDNITIHINSDNKISYDVFSHIGFKHTSNTLYKIDYKDLLNYLK